MSILDAWYRLAYKNQGPMKLAAPLLIPGSWLFSALARFRRWGYQKNIHPVRHIDIPILSIGNITVGGVGKTPMTLFLVEFLKKQGYSPGVLIRGYKRKSKNPLLLTNDRFLTAQVSQYGDEAALIHRMTRVPVAINRDRVAGAEAIRKNTDCNILLMDDGFQHLRLGRNIDLVMLDGNCPLGNGYTLPYGPLREPVSALQRASGIVLRGSAESLPSTTDSLPFFEGQLVWRSIVSLPDWLDQRFDSSLEPSHFPQKTIQLVSGIANPNRLEKQARDYGFRVQSHIRYPDHHWFSAEELELVTARAGSSPILLTEKDAVRLLPLGEPSLMRYSALYVIRAEWCMQNEAVFTDWLLNRLEVEKRSRKDMNS